MLVITGRMHPQFVSFIINSHDNTLFLGKLHLNGIVLNFLQEKYVKNQHN